MLSVYNTVYTTDPCSNPSVFIPCCNVPTYNDYQSRHFQEVYYAPEPPAEVQVVRSRLPDPPPDVIERVVVVPQPKKYVYQVVEVPAKPPPVIQQRVVHQSPNQPLCGGTYRVQVPPNSVPPSPVLAQSSSNIHVPPSTYAQASSPVYVQRSGSPVYVQQYPGSYSTPQVITI